jgi:hypothetical protein
LSASSRAFKRRSRIEVHTRVRAIFFIFISVASSKKSKNGALLIAFILNCHKAPVAILCARTCAIQDESGRVMILAGDATRDNIKACIELALNSFE